MSVGVDLDAYRTRHFDARPDLTPYLYHFTRATDNCDAYMNLVMMLDSGRINGSSRSGFVRGANRATCFIDIPEGALPTYFENEKHVDTSKRHEPYGIRISKLYAYRKGARPVIYLPFLEAKQIGIKPSEYWRVVRLDLADKADSVCFLHEREWRCKGNFKLPGNILTVFVSTRKEASDIRRLFKKSWFPCDKYKVMSLESLRQSNSSN